MTRYTPKYDAAFWEDLKNTLTWYDSISKPLGDNFLKQLSFAETRLKKNPYAFTQVSKTAFRRILIKKFPYKIFFRIEGATIHIIALIHASRSNRYVQKRLRNN